MKKVFYLSLTLFIVTLLASCKETAPVFSPGESDPRITGTWQLIERRFSKDSTYSFQTINTITRSPADTTVKVIGGSGTTVKWDTVVTNGVTTYTRRDTLYVRRDTSYYTTRRYPTSQPQTLTFDASGQLSASGPEMTYYNPIKYYRIDKTFPDSLSIDFFIYTNRANVPFRQGLAFRKDTLVLQPQCEQRCYSKFIRVR
ncbi:hypothetical protein IC229_23465 [Spirosoma sp. BT702]|uniref:Lipocalin-like domain-containing protein n=1 Tax=Spirosoma profusum TaxID=2771354 RepID=A0A926Y3Q8_9BACT|nr:hypothetical protein [Spirosoma profusum]MBD2703623.1 hypothetical protein [Spirosoma profusum]